MLGVTDSSRVWEELGCKEGTSLGVSEWVLEEITECYMIGPIESIIEFTSLEIFQGAYEGVK